MIRQTNNVCLTKRFKNLWYTAFFRSQQDILSISVLLFSFKKKRERKKLTLTLNQSKRLYSRSLGNKIVMRYVERHDDFFLFFLLSFLQKKEEERNEI